MLLLDSNSSVQLNTAEALANIGGVGIPVIIPILLSNNASAQNLAMQLLAGFGPSASAAIPVLITLATNNRDLRQTAFDTLVQIGPNSITAITALLTSRDADLAARALTALTTLRR
ncbi:MAG: hypothetical protein FWC85_04655, partial [Elusimicrobia bacterium]|nr:hypothetical protein [Elusimicrobiota bacterium]